MINDALLALTVIKFDSRSRDGIFPIVSGEILLEMKGETSPSIAQIFSTLSNFYHLFLKLSLGLASQSRRYALISSHRKADWA